MRVYIATFCLLALGAGCGAATCNQSAAIGSAQYIAMQTAQSSVQTARAEARVEQWGKEGRIRGTVLMMLQSPDRLRFDVVTQFGAAATMTTADEKFLINDKRDGRFVTGSTCPRNLAAVFGIRMTPGALFDMLTGRAPDLGPSALTSTCKRGQQMLTQHNGDEGYKRVIARRAAVQGDEAKAESLIVESVTQFNGNSKPSWIVEYGDHRWDAALGRWLPGTIRFIDKDLKRKTVIRVKSFESGIELPEGAFFQAPAATQRVETLSCPPG